MSKLYETPLEEIQLNPNGFPVAFRWRERWYIVKSCAVKMLLGQRTARPKKLAANLGVEQSHLVDAVKQTALQLVNEAIQQGKITSDQAQKIKDRIEQGKLFPVGRFLRPGKGAKAGLNGKQPDELTQVLGMSADELRAELQQGKKIAEIVREKGLASVAFIIGLNEYLSTTRFPE